MKNLSCFLIPFFLLSLESCKLLKNATAPEAFLHAQMKDSDYVANEGGKAKETKLENEWPTLNNHDDNTVGSALQGHFSSHCQSCTDKSIYDSLDYVPKRFRNIRNDFSLATKVQTIKSSIGNLFFYTFTTNEKDVKFGNLTERLLADRTILSPSRVVGLNDFDYATATFQAAPGYSGFLLKQNCAGYIDAEFNANITPPLSAIKTSLKTDLERKSSVLLVDGYFKSPVNAILSKRNNESINTYFYLWKIYQENSSLIDNAWYLDVFRGLMANRIVSESSNFELDASLSAAYESQLIDINGKFSTGFQLSKEFNLQDWETYIYLKDDLDAELKEFKPFPNPDKIIEVIYKLDESLTGNLNPLTPFSKNIPHTHVVSLMGVPEDFCNQKWNYELKNQDIYKSSSVSINSEYKFENGQDICECSLTGTPQDKWFPKNRSISAVQVEYDLINTEKVSNKELKVQIKRSISTTGEPKFITLNSPIRSKISASNDDSEFYLQWNYNLELQDKQGIVMKPSDNPGITVPNTIDLSANSLPFNLAANIIYDPIDRSKYNLIIKISIPIKESKMGQIISYDDASININIEAKVQTGGEVDFVINNVVIPLPVFEKEETIKK